MAVQSGNATFADGFLVQIGRMTEGLTNFRSDAGTIFGDFFSSFSTGFADSIGQAIVGTQDLGEALQNVARQAIAELISGLVQLGIRYVLNATLGNALAAASTAATAAQASALAAAWAPAAALASLATGGANAIPAAAAIGSTTAFATATAAVAGAGIPGFQDGGLFSGVGGPRTDSNLVRISDGEFIVNASATQRNLGLLRSINSGQSPATSGASQASNPTIQVINNAPGVQIREEISEGRIRLIAEEVASSVVQREVDPAVGRAISNPNSATSRSLGSNTQAGRRF